MPPKKAVTQLEQQMGKVVMPNGDLYEGEFATEGDIKYRHG